MSDPTKVTVVDQDGNAFDVDPSQVADLQAQGMRVESNKAEQINRVSQDARKAHYSDGAWNKGAAVIAGGARTITGGMSDAALAGLGAGEDIAALKEYNPGYSTIGEIAGAFIPTGLPGLASRAGKAVGAVEDGASIGARLAGAAKGAAVEGAIYGVGSGVSEVALSKDPLSLERAVSTIGSSALFGGAVGGAAGALTKAAGIGLRGVQSKLDDVASRGAAEVDDTAKIALRDEVAAFRQEVKQSKVWLATKDSGVDGLSTIGKRTLKADKALDNLLDDPKALIDNPKAALRHLRVQESALAEVAAKTDELRASLTTQQSVSRLAALDKVAPTLERNRALQAKIGDLIAKPAAMGGAGGIGANMLGGQAFGLGASLVGAIPVVGPLLAPIAGAAASKLVTEGLGKMATKQAARASKAIGSFLNVAEKLPNVAPVLASKVLTSVKFGEGKAPKPVETKPGKAAPKIAAAYKARTTEIKQLTQYGPDGKAMMRPDARQKMAASFDAVRAFDPVAADQMETLAARRIAALADRIPRKPDVMGTSVGGPDRWQPSDMQMRGYARFVAAVEDPVGVIERLATGQITPEDAEAMKTVYPELYADVQRQIMATLPTLKQTLPYQRRIALSIFSGIPVDPAMDPRIMSVLQQSFVDEPGTEGGTQAPTPQPAFGSVKNQEATPSQQRSMT